MKKIILTAFVLFIFAGVFAQSSNVVLFSENGERFYAVMNGIRMNEEPVTNLKVEDLIQPGYKLRVIFENTDLGQMDKNLYLEAGQEMVFMIRQDRRGRYKLAMRSSAPIFQAAPVGADCYVYHWGAAVQQPMPASTTVITQTVPATTGVSTTVVEQTTTTTTGGGSGDNVSMNVNMGGFGMDVNINTNDAVITDDVTTTTTTTTTTTSGGYDAVYEEVYVEEPAPCAIMSSGEFGSAKSSIKSKSFSDSKMTLAKQITRNHCMSAMQIREIMELFSFEENKLEYAKFAFPFCFDQNNFYQVN
ncbi:MAG TPA: DUF4476 domain-containing protein, partial [Bacteroidetes bacterium]|nr:DUF4476 domain-containing protein [Bacteroidota bacterium]